jgi:hypothetical protein
VDCISYKVSANSTDNLLLCYLCHQWKTPWLEMSLNEMPRFMLSEAVLLHPVLPKKNENDKHSLWNPDMDIKM